MLRSGQVIEKVTMRHIPEIQRLSLLGAFRYVEIEGKHGRPSVQAAKTAFCKASLDGDLFSYLAPGQIDAEIERIDQDTYDSRQVDRNLRAAAKKLRKAGKSAKSASSNQTQGS